MSKVSHPRRRPALQFRRVLQGVGFVLLHEGEQVAVAHQCIGNKAWSVRVSGGRFLMSDVRRFMADGRRKYDGMTYVDTGVEALHLAKSCLAAQQVLQPLSPMWRTGMR